MLPPFDRTKLTFLCAPFRAERVTRVDSAKAGRCPALAELMTPVVRRWGGHDRVTGRMMFG